MYDIEKDYTLSRKDSGSYKWDGMSDKYGEDGLIPLWVADMDFKAPEVIISAMKKHLEYGVFGYAIPSDGYYEAVIDWEMRRHGYQIKREWLRYTPGVVPGIFWCLNALTQPDEACLVLTPCYYPFLDAVKISGRKLICCDLVQDHGVYTVDLKEFEDTICRHQIKLFLLCSPHNPVGRVWSEEELRGMLDICQKHHVYVISDEIHQDIIMSGCKHIPSATLGDYDSMLITIAAPSKSFNLAGLQNAFAIIPNPALKARVENHIRTIRINKGTTLGYVAAEAAYRLGEPWLEAVNTVIEGNFNYLKAEMQRGLPEAVVTPLEGTYLMWIELGAYLNPNNLVDVVQHQARLAVDFGKWFWDSCDTDTHIRINLATSRENIRKAAGQLISSVRQSQL